jgi:hypothetical protein
MSKTREGRELKAIDKEEKSFDEMMKRFKLGMIPELKLKFSKVAVLRSDMLKNFDFLQIEEIQGNDVILIRTGKKADLLSDTEIKQLIWSVAWEGAQISMDAFYEVEYLETMASVFIGKHSSLLFSVMNDITSRIVGYSLHSLLHEI